MSVLLSLLGALLIIVLFLMLIVAIGFAMVWVMVSGPPVELNDVYKD